MTKTITLKSIKDAIGTTGTAHNILSGKQAFFMVVGAAECLGDDAWKNSRVTEVVYPSNAAMKKLARQIWPKH